MLFFCVDDVINGVVVFNQLLDLSFYSVIKVRVFFVLSGKGLIFYTIQIICLFSDFSFLGLFKGSFDFVG